MWTRFLGTTTARRTALTAHRAARKQLPSAGEGYRQLDGILGAEIDSPALSMVLSQDLEVAWLRREVGLLTRIAPQLMNMLARGQAWDHVLSAGEHSALPATTLKAAPSGLSSEWGGLEGSDDDLSDTEESWEQLGGFPDRGASAVHPKLWEFALTPKVLLTFMTARFMHQERLRLVAWAQAIYPLPFVFRHPDEDGRFVVDALHMQIFVRGTFMASIPFQTRGNSQLLNHLFRRNFELSPSRISPLHAGSVDLSLTQQIEAADAPIEPFHVMDFHTGSGLEELRAEERAAIQSGLRFAHYFLVHFPLKEGKSAYRETKAIVLEQIKPLVENICNIEALRGQGKRFFFLARDVSEGDVHLETKKRQLGQEFRKWEAEFECEGAFMFECMPDLSNMAAIQRNSELGRVFEGLREHFKGAAGYDDFWSFHASLERATHAESGNGLAVRLPSTTSRDLDLTRKNYLMVSSALGKVGSDFSQELQWSSTPFVQEHAEQLSGLRAETLSAILNRRQNMWPSDLLGAFLDSVGQSASNLQEWKLQLAAVADRHAAELADLRVEYLKARDEHRRLDEAIAKEVRASGQIVTPGLESKRSRLKTRCISIARQMDSKIVTPEKLWRELVEFYDCYAYIRGDYQEAMTFAPNAVVDAFTACMQRGFAMELLDGDHLVVHPEFLAAVFEKFARGIGEAGCRTISILGPQSSGKSTLANALWGGEFATSAGRCTKGLYASAFPTDFKGLPMLLFLDTEGLCSVENDAEFDQKLALLTIAMSDVVLINVRGDLDSKVSSILQMAVFCLKEMSILTDQRIPELVFIQRDMVDFSKSKSATMMSTLEQSLRDATKLLANPDGSAVELHEVLNFDRNSLFLMPSAFKPVDKVLRSHSGQLQVPNPEFGAECFKLRRKIVDLAVSGSCNVKSLQQWGQRFCTVKATIDKFKDLANFNGVLSLQTRQAFDEQVKKLLDVHVYGVGPAGTAGDAEVVALDALLTMKQVELEALLADAFKMTYPDGATGRERELESIKRQFENYCNEQVARLTAADGTLVLTFKTFCSTNNAISEDMQREGIRTLQHRVELLVNSRRATFETIHQRSHADNMYQGIFEELRRDLSDLRQGVSSISRAEAVELFDSKWAAKRQKLLSMLKATHPNYRDIASQSIQSFASTLRIAAISPHTIMGAQPDPQLSSICFSPLMHAEPLIYEKAELPQQFDASVKLLLGSARQKAATEGLWHYRARHAGKEEQGADEGLFVIAADEMGRVVYHGVYQGHICTGTLGSDMHGKVVAKLANQQGREIGQIHFKFPRGAWSLSRLEFSFYTGGAVEWIPATKQDLKEGSLSNVCSFFGVAVPEGLLGSGFDLANPRTWLPLIDLGFDASNRAMDALTNKAKSDVMIAAYEWLNGVIDKSVQELDEELSNLTVVLKHLYQTVSSPGSAEELMLWEFSAVMKNECLRAFRSRAEVFAEGVRAQKDEATVLKFEEDVKPLKDNFIKAVTQVQNDRNNASAFAEEFWILVKNKTKLSARNAAVWKVTSKFSNPAACQEHCDEAYIGKFGTPEGKTAAEVFEYVVNPAAEMRRHVSRLCDDQLSEAQSDAEKAWQIQLDSIKDRFITLCQDVQRRHRVVLEDLGSGAEGAESERAFARLEQAGKATFDGFLELINEGSARMQYGSHTKTIKTDIKVLGEDHGKYTVTSSSVNAISSLDAFLNALVQCLQGFSNTEPLRIDMDEQKKVILNEWVGCQEQCPYCGKKCSLPKHDSGKHKCGFHQPIGFGGVKVEANNMPLFITCDEMDNQGRIYRVLGPGRDSVLVFPKHVAQCHPTWHITSGGDAGRAAFNRMAAGYEKVWGDSDFRSKICSHYALANISWSDGARLARVPFLSKLQIALVLDTTSSMRGEIDQCKTACLDMIRAIRNETSAKLGSQVSVEFAFCGYKDHGDTGHLQFIDFQHSADHGQVESLIAKQTASGGGDPPEDMLGAFRVVNSFSWADVSKKGVLRVMVLIADVPCHGPAYAPWPWEDHHPADGEHMPKILMELTNKGINCCFSVINAGITEKMEEAFREHWRRHGDVQGESRCTFTTFHGRREAGDHILEQAAKSIQALIQRRVSDQSPCLLE